MQLPLSCSHMYGKVKCNHVGMDEWPYSKTFLSVACIANERLMVESGHLD